MKDFYPQGTNTVRHKIGLTKYSTSCRQGAPQILDFDLGQAWVWRAVRRSRSSIRERARTAQYPCPNETQFEVHTLLHSSLILLDANAVCSLFLLISSKFGPPSSGSTAVACTTHLDSYLVYVWNLSLFTASVAPRVAWCCRKLPVFHTC